MLGQIAMLVDKESFMQRSIQEVDSNYSNSKFIDTLQTVIPNLLGPIGAAVLFYHIGAKLVDNMFEECAGDLHELKRSIIVLFAKNSFGVIEIEDNKCLSRLNICTKPLPLAGSSSIGCYFVRGIFQRYLKLVKGFDVEVEESRCVSKGSRFCEFRVKEV
ncbi:MAG: 4-vinyl reductase [Nitrososphaerales archaeon]